MAFRVGGCWYPSNYRSISYPLSSYPSGGVWNKLPDFYQDYEKEKKKWEEKYFREREEKQRRKFAEFFRRFMEGQGFFGYNEEIYEERKEEGYPFSVFGLKKSASNDDMKKAYRKKILETHPDKGGCADAFRKVKEAYDYFKDLCLS